MRTLITVLLLSCATIAQATIITFTGVVTTRELVNYGDLPAAEIGSLVEGYFEFDHYKLFVKEAHLIFPNGFIGADWGLVEKVPSGYSYYNDSGLSNNLGFDGVFGFTLLGNGSGTFFGAGWYYDDFPEHLSFLQSYTGNITSVSVSSVPDTGTTLGLFGIALLILSAVPKNRAASAERVPSLHSSGGQSS